MARREVPVHYLRPNETTWTPPSVICADTETRVVSENPEVHALRLWVARQADRRKPRTGAAVDRWADGETAAGLAATVDRWCIGRETVWLYCHNLSFDLAVTRLPLQLGRLGWAVSEAAIDGRSCWLRMAKGRKTLTLTDSFTWLPVPLDEVGRAVGVAKPALPDWDDTDDRWLHRCGEDVSILSGAMLRLMDWWDEQQLGRWAITGGATAWNAYRHKPAPVRVLVRPDPGQIAADRAAVYGGRRYTWRHGPQPPGRYLEMDFSQAHATVAAHLPLPVMRARQFESLPADTPLVGGGRWGAIAAVQLCTDQPRWPVRISGRVWYPVGTFPTVLADPDIADARRLGCLRAIGPGHLHQLGHAMAPWARWILKVTGDTSPAVPAVAKIACKHAGRAVIGKWAQHGYERCRLGLAPTDGWGYGHAWDHTRGCPASILDLGGQRFVSVADGDSDNCYPAVLAFVESYVRVRLGAAVDAVGADRVVACDTDGLIVAEHVAPQLDPLADYTAPLVMRAKQVYTSVAVTGPQHLQLDGVRRFSGVPRSAAEQPDGTLRAKAWPKLAWQIAHGTPGGFTRPELPYRIQGPYVPGWCLLDGVVAPVEARTSGDGTAELVPWEQTRWARSGARLAPAQNAALKGLW